MWQINVAKYAVQHGVSCSSELVQTSHVQQ